MSCVAHCIHGTDIGFTLTRYLISPCYFYADGELMELMESSKGRTNFLVSNLTGVTFAFDLTHGLSNNLYSLNDDAIMDTTLPPA